MLNCFKSKNFLYRLERLFNREISESDRFTALAGRRADGRRPTQRLSQCHLNRVRLSWVFTQTPVYQSLSLADSLIR